MELTTLPHKTLQAQGDYLTVRESQDEAEKRRVSTFENLNGYKVHTNRDGVVTIGDSSPPSQTVVDV